MNVVRVIINDVEYSLKGEEKEEYLHKVASYVNRKIQDIKDKNSKLSTSSVSTLTAVNIADELFKLECKYEEILNNIDLINKEYENIKQDNISLKKQLKHMENYNDELLEKVNKSSNAEFISELEEVNGKLREQIEIMNNELKNQVNNFNEVKQENNVVKLKNQSLTSEIIKLKKELVSKDIDLVKEKKMRNPLKKVQDI